MRSRLLTRTAAAVALAAAAELPVGSARAATEPVSDPHVLIHYDLAAGQQPENIAPVPGGDFDVVLSRAAQVERISPQGRRRFLAALPVPADGGKDTPALGYSLATGIARTPDGTLYVGYAAGHDELTGIWRIRPGGEPRRIVALGADSFPNGMALDPRTRQLYFADSARGLIWRVPTTGGTPTRWLDAPELKPTGLYGLGANGLKIHKGAVWVTNSDQGTLLRIPIEPGGAPGPIATRLTGPHLDDFTFIGGSDTIVATLDPDNKVALVQPDGTYRIVLTGQDGLQGPTSAAVRHGRLYVLNAAFLTHQDPNIVVADIDVRAATRR
jgi:hypothetical protein